MTVVPDLQVIWEAAGESGYNFGIDIRKIEAI